MNGRITSTPGWLAIVFALAALMAGPASVPAAERVVLVAGGGTDTNSSTLPDPTQARLNSPFGVDFDRAGNLYLVEMVGQYVRRLDPSGTLTIIAGTGRKGDSGDGGRALA